MTELPSGVLKEALRLLGVSGEADAELTAELKGAYETLSAISRPKRCWKLFEITVTEDETLLAGSLLLKGAAIAETLRGCGRAAVTAVTLGYETDRYIARLQRERLSQAVITDALASAEAERMCCLCEPEILEDCGPGAWLTRRFSPGYGGTELRGSEPLLLALEAEKSMGITLSSSGLLLPVKSVTAITGIAESPRDRGVSCGECAAADSCQYRKRGAYCGA